MKILLVSGILVPTAAKRLGVPPLASGGWIQATIEALRKHYPEITLGVVAKHPNASGRFEDNNVAHFVLRCNTQDIVQAPKPFLVSEIRKIINGFTPDVIHVNGSEFSFGMAVRLATPEVPALLTVQGISFLCRRVERRVLPFRKQIRYNTLRDLASRIVMRSQEAMERETIGMYSHITGRTAWDKAHVRAMNPRATYYSVNRLLRSEFWDVTWKSQKKTPLTVFSNAGGKSYKGIHTLLEALTHLKKDYPNIKARIPGLHLGSKKTTQLSLKNKGYSNYLHDLVEKWDLGNHVRALGFMNAKEMAGELTSAHVFTQVSHIENSPNSLSEAMLVGTPSIASYCGGTGSIIKDQEEGLMYPVGDSALLANHIRSLFENEELCQLFSRNARRRAAERHDETSVAQDMMNVYRKVIGSSSSRS